LILTGSIRLCSALTVAGQLKRPGTVENSSQRNSIEGGSGETFLEFFQIDKETGNPKGIIVLDLRRLS
jgi:hypothetical protein